MNQPTTAPAAPGGTRDSAHDAAAWGPGGLRGAIAAEWTKLWSLRSTWWGLLAAFGAMAAMAGTLGGSVASNNTNAITTDDQGVMDAGQVAAGAVDLVQFIVLLPAILMITGEYATGAIRTTLQGTPSRTRMLLGKATVVAAVTLATGLALGAVGTAAAYPMLGEWGRLPAAGTARDIGAIGLYLALTSVLVVGVAALLRSTAGTLTSAFAFLMVVPMMLANSGMPALVAVSDALPGGAGRHLLTGDGDPYPPSVALAIVTAWAALALWAGRLTLHRRDA